jgi:methylglutaconyl-CoA hydratase
MWRNGDWARKKGLFAELHPSVESMDESIIRLSHTLVASSPEATAELKKLSWQGTENWDKLLIERAAISGRLITSEYSKKAIEKIKQKQVVAA